MAERLTTKQARFVEEFLVNPNATQAAIRAGYSHDTARAIGCENLTKPRIAAAVAEANAERSKRVRIAQDDVVQGLLAEATLVGDGASHSARVSAWGLLGKHLGMFRDKVDVHHSMTLEQLVLASMKPKAPV